MAHSGQKPQNPLVPGTQVPRPKIDRDALHRYLWRRTNSRNQLVIRHRDLAEAFDVSAQLVGKACRAMRDEGRMRQVHHTSKHLLVFEVADPATFRLDDPTTHSRRRIPAWG